jgi:hypothetical protein
MDADAADRDTKQPFMARAQAAPPEPVDLPEPEEEAEDDTGYTVDHLSAVVRPVALTMILARCGHLRASEACPQPLFCRTTQRTADAVRLGPRCAALLLAKSESRAKILQLVAV